MKKFIPGVFFCICTVIVFWPFESVLNTIVGSMMLVTVFVEGMNVGLKNGMEIFQKEVEKRKSIS